MGNQEKDDNFEAGRKKGWEEALQYVVSYLAYGATIPGPESTMDEILGALAEMWREDGWEQHQRDDGTPDPPEHITWKGGQ